MVFHLLWVSSSGMEVVLCREGLIPPTRRYHVATAGCDSWSIMNGVCPGGCGSVMFVCE